MQKIINYKEYQAAIDLENFQNGEDGDVYRMNFDGHYLIEMEKKGDSLISTGKAMDGHGNPVEIEPFICNVSGEENLGIFSQLRISIIGGKLKSSLRRYNILEETKEELTGERENSTQFVYLKKKLNILEGTIVADQNDQFERVVCFRGEDPSFYLGVFMQKAKEHFQNIAEIVNASIQLTETDLSGIEHFLDDSFMDVSLRVVE